VIDDERRAEAVIQAIRKLVSEAPLIRERVELDRVVEDVLRMLAERATEQKVTIENHRGGAGTVVMGDSIQLSQVVLNLVTNALDALAESGVNSNIVVTVRCNGDQVILTVEDNGPGFSSNILGEAFEPWVTTRPEGMGLGLALVKRIITSLEGSVIAKNGPHVGARVEVRLPAAIS
jgi:C4-dicarboxylate-specific signal transduction histidine kinase